MFLFLKFVGWVEQMRDRVWTLFEVLFVQFCWIAAGFCKIQHSHSNHEIPGADD